MFLVNIPKRIKQVYYTRQEVQTGKIKSKPCVKFLIFIHNDRQMHIHTRAHNLLGKICLHFENHKL